jgi:hypothetical protein
MATASRDLPGVPVGLGPHPHVLREALLLALMAASVLPFALHAGGLLLGPLGALAALAEVRVFKVATGCVGAALIAGQLLLPALRRWGGRVPPRTLARLQDIHALNGAPLLLVVLAHTGGRPGSGASSWLLAALAGMLLVAQAGHVAKAVFWWRAQSEPTDAALHRNAIANTADGWVHQSGLQLHVGLAVLVLVLLAFHVLAFFYF